MDDLEIDLVVEVPDTPPDRLISRNWNCNNLSPFAGLVEIQDSAEGCSDQQQRDRAMGRQENGRGRNRRLFIRPPKRIGPTHECGTSSRPFIISPLDNSSASRPSKKLKIVRSYDDGQRRTSGALDMDGVEATSSGSSYKVSVSPENITATNLMKTVKNSHCQLKLGQAVGKSCRVEEKAKESTSCNATCSSLVRGKEIDSSDTSIDECLKKPAQTFSIVSSSRPTRQKRLVRNGCISPHNITSKAKGQEVGSSSSSNAGLSHMSHAVSSGLSPCTRLNEIVSEENRARIKGKGILSYRCSSNELGKNSLDASTRNLTTRRDEECVGTGDTAGCVAACDSEVGWRSTRNKLRSYRTGKAASICENVARDRNQPHHTSSSRMNFSADKDLCSGSSRRMSDDNRVDVPPHATNAPTRGRNRWPIVSRDGARFSRLGSEDSEVMIIGSSEESPNSSSLRLQNHGWKQALDSEIEFNESSPQIEFSDPQVVDPNPGADSRARQVEADELLALELQKQLYDESLQIDHTGQLLGQVEHYASSSGFTDRSPFHRSTRVTCSSTQFPPRSSQSAAIRRERSANVSTTRIRLSRRESSRHSSRLLSRVRAFNFPLDMAANMTIDAVEAMGLEAAFAVLDDTPIRTNGISRMRRNFNENDYEMLLALDENVRPAGTSSTHINSLPESKVQIDVTDEACAVCLENPKKGETIRHLPCFHKFHKDCIDPWLNRSTSCPVCKQSVT